MPKHANSGRFQPAAPLAVRFWQRVDKTGDCWIWTGAKIKFGYGVIRRNSSEGGAQQKTHRVSWELHNGPIPQGLMVLHRCDNPPCVRPDHLFLGTGLDNVADREAKGRTAKGDNSGARLHPERHAHLPGELSAQAKLTNDDVLQITARYKSGSATQRQLASEYGIGQAQISRILLGKRWRHLEGAGGLQPKPPKVTDEQVREIRRLYASRVIPQRELAAEFGVSHALISQIVTRTARKAVL